MAIPIINNWQSYFLHHDEGLGSSYERVILNLKLEQIARLFSIEHVLEAPCFGFTGISGMNSMGLAKAGKFVTLIEQDKQRIEFMKEIWESVNLPITIKHVEHYERLPVVDKKADLSWNFSALWFVQDLQAFLQELIRVTQKVIFLCVPNQLGLGYLSQKIKSNCSTQIREEFIQPKRLKAIMNSLGWQLLQTDYIDSPPWPDIGMPKEAFFQKFGFGQFYRQKEKKSISILPYYQGKDDNFYKNMLKYYWFEKNLPDFCKRFWAHHQYFCFIPNHEKA
jgi:SAM-dependent methyltransferase